MENIDLNNYEKFFEVRNKIEDQLRSSDLLKDQECYEISSNVLNGELKLLRELYFNNFYPKDGWKDEFFEFFNSVAIVTVGKEKVLIFKTSGRLPWELQLILTQKTLFTKFYPCKIYWKNKWCANFPEPLLKKYPTIFRHPFWQNLGQRNFEEIPLNLIKQGIITKNAVFVRNVLTSENIMPQKRGKHGARIEFTLVCRKQVIRKYEELCKKDLKYRNRFPIKELGEFLGMKADELPDSKGKELPNEATIYRWLIKHNSERDEKLEHQRWTVKNNKIRKAGGFALTEGKFLKGIPANWEQPLS